MTAPTTNVTTALNESELLTTQALTQDAEDEQREVRAVTLDSRPDIYEDEINIEVPDSKILKRKTSNTRETWGKALDFLMACIGFSVGLGNVWRFPYLCYKNGGGAFLIPYFTFVLIGGIPLFYLEVAVGQFMSRGGLQAWNICPLFQGIGLTSCVVVFYLNCYYNVIMAWAFHYFFSSFTDELPWVSCSNPWNNASTCTEDPGQTVNASAMAHDNRVHSDPVTEYWENKVLGLSDGLHDIGVVRWDLALCLLFAWIVVYLCICKGIKSSGKVMYITAPSPYIFMAILLVRNIMLDGASDGIAFYLTPELSKLHDPKVWVDAGTQIFFSSSIALGTLTALGSYNKFNYNSFRDAYIFAMVNSGTSFFAGFIVFSILGHMAKVQNKSVADVAESGPGLAFIAYPKAVAQLPGAPFWSCLFFLMIILLGLDSQFVGVEGVVTTVVDQYPQLLRIGRMKEIFIGVSCIIMFLIGLPMVTQGGMYIFQLFDHYSGSRIILLVALFELIAVSYVYGIRRFADNIKMMVGHSKVIRILPFMLLCWTVLSPCFCIGVFLLNCIDYTELTYKRPNKPMYKYPDYAVALGWSIAGSSAIWIPVVGIYKWWKHGHTLRILKLLTVPYFLYPHQRRPQDENEECLYDHEQSDRMYNYCYEGAKYEKTAVWTIGYTGYKQDYQISLSGTPTSTGSLAQTSKRESQRSMKSEKHK